MQGWTPDFIPRITEEAVDLDLVDEILPINGNEALRMARELARREGIFSGTSGGATFAGALEVAGRVPPNTTVLCMLPDTGERYLSTPLFEGIPEQMSDEEMEISRSTPSARFDAGTSTPAAGTEEEVSVSAKAEAFLEEVLSDTDRPVVLFALEWCEFCWSIRKLFAQLGVPYRAVDLDSVAYQENDWGGEVRRALQKRVGSKTIPHIFVAGEHLGGATDTFEAYKSGKLDKLLQAAGIEAGDLGGMDPYELLPGWLHKR
jgi:cysteine synthase A